MKPLISIEFHGTKQIEKLLQERADLLYRNARAAVASSVLYAITRISADTPVDTGRLRASIAGDLGDRTGVDIQGPNVSSAAIAEGRQESLTSLDGLDRLEGRVGTNVSYALPVEYGHRVKFRVGSQTKFREVRGRAMFRKNVPLIRRYFREEMQRGVRAATKGKRIGWRQPQGGA